MFKEMIPDHPISRYRKDEQGKFIKMEKERPCPSVDTPVIMSDGSVCLCWYDAFGESIVGNINEDTFNNIWKKSKSFRKKMMKGNALTICDECLGCGAAGRIIHFK